MNDGSSLSSGEKMSMVYREVDSQNTHARVRTLKTVTAFDSRHNLTSTDRTSRTRPIAAKINMSGERKRCIQNGVMVLVI